jgi:uncharacterized protein (DUF58 family)
MLYAVPVGVPFFLLSAAALVAGFLLKETALLVFGVFFLALLGYCLGACLALFLVYRKRAAGLSVDFAPPAAAIGEPVAVVLSGGKRRFRAPPGLLVRYQIRLETRDGRVMEKVFPRSFFTGTTTPLPGGAGADCMIAGEKRGAYFGAYDYLLICDLFGFFRMAVKIAARRNERLLIYPHPRRERRYQMENTGGDERTTRNTFVPNDDLIEQRQYVPGDDPRRINWKLYGHSGALFVREGERRGNPPPEIILAIDTRTDKKDKAEVADVLCNRALEIAVRATLSASPVTLRYRGGGEQRWTPDRDRRDLYALFALPFAVSGDKAAETDAPDTKKAVVIQDE